MIQTGVQLEINAEIIEKLGAARSGFWCASHSDGSDNRINGDAILDAATIDTSLGIVTAVFQGLRKAFRNRRKTKEDLSAEKEAAKINKTCGMLDVLLRDYLCAAQEGSIEAEDLDLLISILQDAEGWCQSGELKVSGRKELAAICRSIDEYTAAFTGSIAAPDRGAAVLPEEAFRHILEALSRQKQWICGNIQDNCRENE